MIRHRPVKARNWLMTGSARSLTLALTLSGAGLGAARAEAPQTETSAFAQLRWGAQVSLVQGAGDLRDTTGSRPGFSAGGFCEYPVSTLQKIRLRMDGITFQNHTASTQGSLSGNPYTRDVRAGVSAWTLGAEYLIQPLPSLPQLSVGGGLAWVGWRVSTTDTTTVQISGTAVSTSAHSTPTWNSTGVSLVADYQCTRHLSVEARWLSSKYGWQGERSPLTQLGVIWSF